MTAEDSTATQPSSRLQRFGPGVMAVLMLIAGLALTFPLVAARVEPPSTPQIPFVALLACFLAFELVLLRMQVGGTPDNAREVNLTEVVLAVGILLGSPLDVLIAAVSASVLPVLLQRRQSPLKQFFNGALRVFEVAVALSLYHAIAPENPLTAVGFGALSVAVVVSSMTSSISVTLVLVLVMGGVSARDLVQAFLATVPVAFVCSAVGFVAGLALHAGNAGVLPLVLLLGPLLLLMRSTTVLTERHLNLVALHAFGEKVSSLRDWDALLRASLDTAADLLAGLDAHVYLDSLDGDRVERVDRGSSGDLQRVLVDQAEVPTARGLLTGKDMVVASARLDDHREVVLVVANRATAMGSFHAEDARVLDMVAHRTGSELRTLLLIDQLRFDALHDTLTGLPNRRALLNSARRHAHTDDIVATWIGLAGLQMVNAALGHDVGDELIVQVGDRLARSCGPGGEVGRIGGGEFVVLQPLGSSDDPVAMAKSVLAALDRPFRLSQAPVLIRASAGVAVLRSDTTVTGDDLLRRADVAMRVALETGRAVEEYRVEMETATPELLNLATDLQAGIASGQLLLLGQPQVRLLDGVITGVEMLVRWDHPRLGLLPPSEFLPLAESTGLERPLTDWVLETAMATLADWVREGLDLTVSVNVPSSSLTDTRFVTVVAELLARHGVPGERLVVEVVESALIASPEMAAEVLQGVADLGVRISIDDFGTGFSSLSHLRRLPVDEIKVDRGFVTTMLTDEGDGAIVRSVLTMGRSLGLTVVAEGVEDQRVYDALRALGCEYAQGYHIAKPMPLNVFAAEHRLRLSGVPLSDSRA